MKYNIAFGKDSDKLTNDENMLLYVNNNDTIAYSKAQTQVDINYDTIFEYIVKRFNKVPTIEHKCHNCGGTLEIKTDQGIFKCPYCHSVYAIGTAKINDRG